MPRRSAFLLLFGQFYVRDRAGRPLANKLVRIVSTEPETGDSKYTAADDSALVWPPMRHDFACLGWRGAHATGTVGERWRNKQRGIRAIS